MNAIKNYILQQVASKTLTQEQAKTLLLELNSATQQLDAAAQPGLSDQPIAIIGMSGRFPKAESADEFWELLRDGVNCIQNYPEVRRKDYDHILTNPHFTDLLIGAPLDPKELENVHAQAGYMKQIDKFDAAFFGIPPSEATYMDPYQRFALEESWAAMEDAGYGGDALINSNTGVYLGKDNTNYSLYRYCITQDPMQLTGSWESIMASRVSYLFNFHGPCMVVDTACSAGLVCVHMACTAIKAGECDMAIAGGINLSITGEYKSRFQGGMDMNSVESDDSVIRTFDANANGTVWGEGIALVLLKPLNKALEDNDHIHAIVKGSAINNDGASNGLTAPNADSQEQVIVKAWENAGINPESLSYIEAHGTGTVLGDPIEFKGLTSAFRRYTQRRQFCAIGSLKTNMGHLVAASGSASLFKVVKQLQHRRLAPTINFAEPNPYISFPTSPLYVNDTLRDWTVDEGPRRAAINSFGFSHTNCHMVIEEAPQRVLFDAKQSHYCVTINAKKWEILRDYVASYQTRCQLPADQFSNPWNLADLSFTSNTGRGHYPFRIAIIASSEAQFVTQLATAMQLFAGDLEALTEQQLQDAAAQQVYFGFHHIVSDKKTQRDAGEITDNEKKHASDLAGAALTEWLNTQDVEQLNAMAQHYCQGAHIEFAKLFADEKRARLALPTYPFERKRVWADPKITSVVDYQTRLHPLVERQSGQTDQSWTYESIFDIDKHWVLSDHKIKQVCVVPGTTYLEMIRFAVTHATGWEHLDLQDIFFLQPMVVEDGTKRTVNIVIEKSDAGVNVHIQSRDQLDPEAPWETHVEGKALPLTDTPNAAPDIEAAKAGTEEQVWDYENAGDFDTGVFQFGIHWQTVQHSWVADKHALAHLSLPSSLQDELSTYFIHPSVLDNAMNLTSQETEDTFLPFMYKSFRYFAPFTQNMYTYLLPKHEEGGETQTYDVVLTDDKGNVLAEITQYITKKVHSFNFSGDQQQNDYLALRWIPSVSELPSFNPSNISIAVLSIEGHSDATADKLASAWQTLGATVAHSPLASSALDAANITQQIKHADTADALVVVLPEAPSDVLSPSAAHLQNTASSALLFHLAKAISEHKLSFNNDITIVTQGAAQAQSDDKVHQPYAAAASQLAMTLDQESPDTHYRVIDIDEADAHIANTLLALPAGKRLALRHNASDDQALALYQQELYPREFDDAETRLPLVDGGVYIISGGLGGLGLAAAQHVAANAKAHVVLLGRSPLADSSEWAALATQASDAKTAARYQQLVGLQSQLASVSYAAVDVSNAEAVKNLIDTHKAKGPIKGVFHAAGVAGDGFIMRKTFDTFAQVLSPKLEGTVNLLQAVDSDNLDFMLLYSSITALTAGEGQGDYAAANAFLDAIAAMHDKVFSINWPSWADVGMAADFGIGDEQSPFSVISTSAAFEKLDVMYSAYCKGFSGAIIPGDVNAAVLAPGLNSLPFEFANELATVIKRAAALQGDDANIGDVEVEIRGKSEDELTETETTLAKVYASVLGLGEIDIFTNFQDMGGNSIIATHLLKVINEYYPDLVDISDVFSYPSIDVMAEYIDEKRGVSPEASSTEAETENSEDWDDKLDQMLEGDASIDDLLDNM